MNLYLDTSALIKLYIRERGTEEVNLWVTEADVIGTCLITLAEANAAIARAVRIKSLSQRTGERVIELLHQQWLFYIKIPISEKSISRAADLAWSRGLRGYDAVQLASAESWQIALGRPVTLGTFDRKLSEVSRQLGLEVLG